MTPPKGRVGHGTQLCQQSVRRHLEQAAEALRVGRADKRVRPDTARDHVEMALRALDGDGEPGSEIARLAARVARLEQDVEWLDGRIE